MSDNYGVQIERLAAQFEESKRVNEELLASNAALKAENEALKADITGMGYDNDSMRHSIANLQRGRQAALDQVAELERELKDTQEQLASFVNGKLWHSDATCAARNKQLASFLNWQPSDPGTKEATECFEGYVPPVFSPVSHGITLAHALRAAMVRLEEAENKMSECRCWDDEHCPLHSVGIARAEADSMENVRKAKINWDRAEVAESQVAALTASLASMTKERDEFERKGIELCQAFGALLMDEQREPRAVLVASLAELRKRMGELEKAANAVVTKAASLCPGCDIGEKFDGDSHKTNCDEGPSACHIDEMGPVVYDLSRALASPPSPAPKEESHD